MSSQPITTSNDEFLASLEPSALASASDTTSTMDRILRSLAPKTFQACTGAMLLRGIPIIPLLPKSKEPCTPHAAYDATTDPAIIARWVEEYASSSNCGACARFDGFWMLDDDIGTLAAKYKQDTPEGLPQTFTVKT